jgi:organic radical activating enzyme
MKKQLRLLVTDKCNRSCVGCCNKQWNLNELPIANMDELNMYELIMITGGEPLLFDTQLRKLLTNLQSVSAPKILYTANPIVELIYLFVDKLLDGVTITLHTADDINIFLLFDTALHSIQHYDTYDTLSLRVNIFNEVNISSLGTLFCNWKIKNNIEWIEDCPLPTNEDFLRIETLWKY